MLSSTGNDVESGANGFRVSRGDLSENGGASQLAAQEEAGNDRPSSVRSSSTAQRSNRSSSQDHDDPLSPSTVHGSTPLSQIGAHSCAPVNDMYLGQGKYTKYRFDFMSQMGNNNNLNRIVLMHFYLIICFISFFLSFFSLLLKLKCLQQGKKAALLFLLGRKKVSWPNV